MDMVALGATKKCALYCRLSKEDRRKEGDFSDSILNQLELLKQYAKDRQWQIIDVYIDDDYSGATLDRPDFSRLLSDAQNKKFDIVLAKTQSRFTRNMADLERILHDKFLEWGTRFIGVVDHIDTADKANKKARQIHGLTNEWYLEDISESIRSVFDTKRQSGLHIGSFAPFGYEKDPNKPGHLIIDNYAADIVRRIFNMYLQGFTTPNIVRKLNNDSVPSPSTYKRELGYNIPTRTKTGLWCKDTVLKILKNRMYIGDMVQGYMKKASYKSNKLINIPLNERIIVQGTHDPIIDLYAFENVQMLICKNRRTNRNDGIPHLFAGKLKCLDCGQTITKKSYSKDKERIYLRCKSSSLGSNLCSPHSIRLSEIIDIVSMQFSEILDSFADIESLVDGIHDECLYLNRIELLTTQLTEIDRKIQHNKKVLKDLYIDKASGIISEYEFTSLNNDLKDETTDLLNREKSIQIEIEHLQNNVENEDIKKSKLMQFADFSELTSDMVRELIDYIEIGEKDKETGYQDIIIHWNF